MPNYSAMKPAPEHVLLETARRLGVTRFRPGQLEVIRSVLAGHNTLALMPTGAGKSLCFQVPALLLSLPVVVVPPLIALLRDQRNKMALRQVEAARLDSTLTRSEARESLAEIAAGEAEIVYVTPEQMENLKALDLLRRSGVSLFVVDEAHCIPIGTTIFAPLISPCGPRSNISGIQPYSH